jgi:hypothetical protein
VDIFKEKHFNKIFCVHDKKGIQRVFARFARKKMGRSGSNFGLCPKFEPLSTFFARAKRVRISVCLFCHVLSKILLSSCTTEAARTPYGAIEAIHFLKNNALVLGYHHLSNAFCGFYFLRFI